MLGQEIRPRSLSFPYAYLIKILRGGEAEERMKTQWSRRSRARDREKKKRKYMHTAGMTSFGTASGYVRYAGAPSPHCYDVASRFHHKILRVRGRHYAAVLARCNSITLCSSINNYVSSHKSTHYPSTTTQCPNKLIPPRKK